MDQRYAAARPLASGRRAIREDGFTCHHCRCFVSAHRIVSGVVNRNHCPYCLWSRCLDLFVPGDRLSACKQAMQPVALTLKASRKRYLPRTGGELMLVHQCADCGKIAINRIAADDDAGELLAVFERSTGLPAELLARIARQDIRLLQPGEAPIVRARLFGETQPSLRPA